VCAMPDRWGMPWAHGTISTMYAYKVTHPHTTHCHMPASPVATTSQSLVNSQYSKRSLSAVRPTPVAAPLRRIGTRDRYKSFFFDFFDRFL
jgi:hypothetical protein